MTSLFIKAKTLIEEDRSTKDIFLNNLWKSKKVSSTSAEVVAAMRGRLASLYVKELQQISDGLRIVVPNRCDKTQLVDLIVTELYHN